ncbi:unnamed protein product [[Candida] boidinii]|nr:unnamed protein product [[Candida] boidinii]
MADLVWSDPDLELLNFRISSRGAGYQFGVNVVNKFLTINKFERIYRAHQLCNEGYQTFWKGKVNTVWSAPNYCYRCGNKASILELFDKDNFRFNVFDASPESDKEYFKLINGADENGGMNGTGSLGINSNLDEQSFKDLLYDNTSNNFIRRAPYVEYFM